MVTPQPGDTVRVAFYDCNELVQAVGTVVAFDEGLLTIESAGGPPGEHGNGHRYRTFNVRSLGFLWFEESNLPNGERMYRKAS